MANICASVQRNKSEVLRKPLLGLWMWYIVLKCVITVPYVYSSCHGVDNGVSLYPQGVIKVLYGEPLELLCVAEEGTADNLTFYTAGKIIPSEKINNTTRKLVLEDLEIQVHTYYCKNNLTKKLCFSRVIVGQPPSAVTDFNCISNNLDVMKCTWTSPDTFSVTKYKLSFVVNGDASAPCIGTRQEESIFCSWNTISTPRYKQLEDYYHFKLESCNNFGCHVQDFVVNHFSIVKPDPPNRERVLTVDSHSALLEWKLPSNMIDFLPCPIVHKIEYQIAGTGNFQSVNASSLPPKNKTYTFLLSNLPYAYISYEVRISIKTALAAEEKFWSDYTYILFKTASEKPQRPPETIAGAFDQLSYKDKRIIYVYWKQLEEYEKAGPNFTYKVVAKQDLNHSQILYPNKHSTCYVIINNATFEAIDVFIWSDNAMGSSVNSSHLYIPSKKDTETLKISSFTKLTYENGTHKLSWVGLNNIDNYTLIWCESSVVHLCMGSINYTVLNLNQNTYVIDLPKDKVYQFAISVNNGSQTSGMTWTSCDVSEAVIPIYNIPIKLDHDNPGKSFVTITWTMACALQESVVTGYLIAYCPVLVSEDKCSEFKYSFYISDPYQMEVNITDLKPHTTYEFMLALNTSYGFRSPERESIRITTTEDIKTEE